jgi:hypothetical protein
MKKNEVRYSVQNIPPRDPNLCPSIRSTPKPHIFTIHYNYIRQIELLYLSILIYGNRQHC